jgi:serine/threonine protein kinase
MADSHKHRTVSLNPARIAELMRANGWSIEQLAGEAKLSTGSVSAVLNGNHPVYWATAEKLRAAFQLTSIDELVSRHNDESVESAKTIREWTLAASLSKWITASNQLQFRIWQLRHQQITKFARGKCYDLQGMADAERERSRASLLRHAEVCSRIGEHPNIIANLTTFESPTRDSWWVIDEWLQGTTLAERLRHERFLTPEALHISRQVAAGIQALHAAGIIRRELSPQTILLAANRVVLTEFELAKLLDGSPTVSTDEWPVDPYRAPEAGADDVDARADIYSWARLTLHMFVGTLPAEGQELKVLRDAQLSKSLSTLLQQSLAVSRRSRPSNMNDVLAALSESS